MHIAARRRLGRVYVAVRVDPQQADFLPLSPVELRHARDGARRHRVISAQNQRNFAGLERLDDHVRTLEAGRGNFFQIFGARRAFFFLLRDGDGDVAGIFHVVANGFEPRLQPGDAYGGWTHVHAAARLAKVEGNADDTNLPRSNAAERRGSQGHNQVFTPETLALYRAESTGSSERHALPQLARSLRNKSSNQMPFPHPQSRKNHYREENKPGWAGIAR